MTGHPIRRTVAVLCAAVLTTALAGSAFAADVEPAAKQKPVYKCAGKVATKVGTPGRDRIRGTNKRDIIVGLGGNDTIDGRGGHDLICAGPGHDLVIGGTGRDRLYGQGGRDRLYGGPGPDLLFGQRGNDRLNGGVGVDTCHQGPGAGLKVSCERPLPPPVVAPTPPPPPPAPKVLARAYTDLNKNEVFDTGDVMISQIVDSNADGTLSKGDTIEMGMYPLTLQPTTMDDFAAWGVKSHIIEEVQAADPEEWAVWTDAYTVLHSWYSEATVTDEQYDEYHEMGSGIISELEDLLPAGANDSLEFNTGSPSKPTIAISSEEAPGDGDDYFIDVIFYT